MTRCVLVATIAVALALPALSWAQARPFPRGALRGEIQFVAPPDVLLNGKPARLSPGARVRSDENLVIPMPDAGRTKQIVHYTIEEQSGYISSVWFLNADELAIRPWPTTPSEAEAWQWDDAVQAWRKP